MDINAILSTSLGQTSLGDVISAVITLVLCIIIIRVVMKLVARMLAKTKLDGRIQKYTVAGIKAVLYIITFITVAASLNIDMTSLVALLSVGSLGLTLAAEDILGNMAGGLVIMGSHPFSIGDFIEVSGVSGTVEEISLNHTKLTTPDGLRVMLPNQELASSQIINYTVRGKRRVKQVVSASYDAPTATVRAACLQAVAMTDNVLADPAPAVYLTNYGDSSIEYTTFCWVEASNYWSVLCSLGENLRTTFAKNGVEMTYNHLNIHIVENRGETVDK
ncbi:MAG: mechanosensitive ion channel family protein [Oscillibacter sp.]|nr:mechanosensitive ion channel family protein [Oscillibacter sp.]